MQKRPRQKQAAVNDVGIELREEIRLAHHVRRVHQKPVEKGVVHPLGAGEQRKDVPVPLQKRKADGAVIRVRKTLQRALHIGEHLPGVIGRCGDDAAQIHIVLPVGKP